MNKPNLLIRLALKLSGYGYSSITVNSNMLGLGETMTVIGKKSK